MSALFFREYGTGTHSVFVLHGGPAAAGDVAPLARELGKRWHAIEPFQRARSAAPLTVSTHIEDLDALISSVDGGPPVLVGHSWGAMLALAYAAAHPTTIAGVALIGCGTFSDSSRAEFAARLDARLSAGDRATIAGLEATEPDANRRGTAIGRLMTRVYGYDVTNDVDDVEFDASAHEQTWADMVRLQRRGVYPAAFAAIAVPVLMLHGDSDPHPGRSIREELRRHIPHLQYQELQQCGHSPWLERHARVRFFDAIDTWLAARFFEADRGSSQPTPARS